MGEHVIEITADGKVHALHSDAFPLQFLGDMKVYRQTNIVSTNNGDTWDIIYLYPSKNGKKLKEWTCGPLRGLPTYELARQVEVTWVNLCRVLGVNPIGVNVPGAVYAECARQLRIGRNTPEGKGIFTVEYTPVGRQWRLFFVHENLSMRYPEVPLYAPAYWITDAPPCLGTFDSYEQAMKTGDQIILAAEDMNCFPWDPVFADSITRIVKEATAG